MSTFNQKSNVVDSLGQNLPEVEHECNSTTIINANDKQMLAKSIVDENEIPTKLSLKIHITYKNNRLYARITHPSRKLQNKKKHAENGNSEGQMNKSEIIQRIGLSLCHISAEKNVNSLYYQLDDIIDDINKVKKILRMQMTIKPEQTSELLLQLKSINHLNHINTLRPQQSKLKNIIIPEDVALAYYASGLPPQDLTRYGIEPNPGPSDFSIINSDGTLTELVSMSQLSTNTPFYFDDDAIVYDQAINAPIPLSPRSDISPEPSPASEEIGPYSQSFYQVPFDMVDRIIHDLNDCVIFYDTDGKCSVIEHADFSIFIENNRVIFCSITTSALINTVITRLVNVGIVVDNYNVYIEDEYESLIQREYDWCLSQCAKNRIVHALNGNIFLRNVILFMFSLISPLLALNPIENTIRSDDITFVPPGNMVFLETTFTNYDNILNTNLRSKLLALAAINGSLTLAGTISYSGFGYVSNTPGNVIPYPMCQLLIVYGGLCGTHQGLISFAQWSVDGCVLGLAASGGLLAFNSTWSTLVSGNVNMPPIQVSAADFLCAYDPICPPGGNINFRFLQVAMGGTDAVAATQSYASCNFALTLTIPTSQTVTFASNAVLNLGDMAIGTVLHQGSSIVGYMWNTTSTTNTYLDYEIGHKRRNKLMHMLNGNIDCATAIVNQTYERDVSVSLNKSKPTRPSELEHRVRGIIGKWYPLTYNRFAALYFLDIDVINTYKGMEDSGGGCSIEMANIKDIAFTIEKLTPDIESKRKHVNKKEARDERQRINKDKCSQDPRVEHDLQDRKTKQWLYIKTQIKSPEQFSLWILRRKPNTRLVVYIINHMLDDGLEWPNMQSPAGYIISLAMAGTLYSNHGELNKRDIAAMICHNNEYNNDISLWYKQKFGESYESVIGILQDEIDMPDQKGNKNHYNSPLYNDTNIKPNTHDNVNTFPSKDVNHGLPPQDLTRYGIEPNPGPTALMFGISNNKYMHMLNGNHDVLKGEYMSFKDIDEYEDTSVITKNSNDGDIINVQSFIKRINGATPVYNQLSTYAPMSTTLTIAGVGFNNSANATVNFSPRESWITLRQTKPTGGGAFVSAGYGMPVTIVTQAAVHSRPARVGSTYQTLVDKQLQTIGLRSDFTLGNGFRAIDVQTMGNTIWGSPHSPRPNLLLADSCYKLGMKAALYVSMYTMANQMGTTASIGGLVNNIDSSQSLNSVAGGITFNDGTLNGAGYPGNNEACVLANVPVYPYDSQAPAAVATQGTGFFTVNATAQILVDNLANTFVVTSEMLAKAGGQSGLIIAMLIALLGPYPHSFATTSVTTADKFGVNISSTQAVFNQCLITIPGFNVINFLIPSISGTNIPQTQAAANAASGYVFRFNLAVGAYAGAQIINTSYSGQINRYEMTSMFKSWSNLINAQTMWEIAIMIARSCGRMNDFNAGAQAAICYTMRYRTMTAAAPGNAIPIKDIANDRFYQDQVDYMNTRPFTVANGTNYPIAGFTTGHLSVPADSLYYMSGCLLDIIQPESTGNGHEIDIFGSDILSPNVFDLHRVTTRTAAAAMDMVYTLYGFPVSFWNNVAFLITPSGLNYDNYTASRMSSFAWQIQRMRNLFISSNAKTSPPVASGSNLIRNALSKFAGVKFCVDSFGYDMFAYRCIPITTGRSVPNPVDGVTPEVLYPFAGITSTVNGVVCDCQPYIPAVLTGIERISVFSKSNPKALAEWPPPLNSGQYKIQKPPNSYPLQGVVGGIACYSYPAVQSTVSLMGNNQQFRVPDEHYWALRYCLNTDTSAGQGFRDALTMSEYAGSKSTAPRNVLAPGANGNITLLPVPQSSLVGLSTAAYANATPWIMNDTFYPAVTIDGARHYMFINSTGNVNNKTWTQWLSGVLLVWAQTKLFTAQQNPIEPVESAPIYDEWDVDYVSDTNRLGQKPTKDSKDEAIAPSNDLNSSSSSISYSSASVPDVSTPAL